MQKATSKIFVIDVVNILLICIYSYLDCDSAWRRQEVWREKKEGNWCGGPVIFFRESVEGPAGWFAYIPPLYLPKKFLQLGHLWVTELRDSIQQGTHAQGHNPTTQRTPAKIHAIGPGSDSVVVLIWH